MWLGYEWCHARKRWAGILGDFEKKKLVEICRWTRQVEIRTWAGPVEIWTWGSWDLKQDDANPVCGLRDAFVGSDGTVSIVKIVCVCLSLSCRKTKHEKLINYLYLN